MTPIGLLRPIPFVVPRRSAAKAAAFAVALAIGLTYITQGGAFGPLRLAADMDAYWNAAIRLREGLPLYPQLNDLDASAVYRYPPWFAVAWVPLTLAPKQLVTAAWVVGMLVASGAAIAPAVRARSAAAAVIALLMIPILLDAAWRGNVEPLLVAALAWGIGGRWEAPAIAFAAATKLTPIAFLAIPLARRDVAGVALAVAMMGALLVPTFIFDLSEYPLTTSGTMSLWVLGPVWWALGAALTVAWLGLAVWRQSKYTLLIAAVVSLAASPRVNLFNLPRLLVGARRGH
jgi:hypothetical protein